MFDQAPPLLLAAAEQIISAIIGLIVLVFWIIGQIAESKKNPAERPGGGRARPGQRPDQADQLRQEVDDYFRQAGGDQGRQPREPRHQPRQARAAPDIEVLIDDDPTALEAEVVEQPAPRARQPQPIGQQRRGRSDSRPQPARPNQPNRPARPKPQQALPESIDDATLAGAGRPSLQEMARRRDSKSDQADVKREAHRHAAFDHDLGNLAHTPSEDAYRQRTNENVAAGRIAAILASPEGVRQAMVLNEILNRPEHRWE